MIRKLGVNDKGESCLDQFRSLISEIGACVRACAGWLAGSGLC